VRYAGLTLALLPVVIGAQSVVVRGPAEGEPARLLTAALTKPYVVRATGSRVDLRRDTTFTTTVIVLGRSATVASKVQGDVIVVGGDLFLHPGVEISGDAIAIGGTVASTTLGRVAGSTRSFRDETYDVGTAGTGEYLLTRRVLVPTSREPVVTLAGLQGFLVPSYDRVMGLSLPIGAVIKLSSTEIQPSLTYRSRLGVIDPRVDVRVGADSGIHAVGFIGQVTRTNDAWIYSDFVNSLFAISVGNDTRNYFRSRDAEGRFFIPFRKSGRLLEPFVGARYERTSTITGVGNVYSFHGRHDDEKMARPNPAVETGNITSLLVGAAMYDTSGVVTSRVRTELEQSIATMGGTSNFTQFTLDLRVSFPTFRTQELRLRGHGVATGGSAIPRSRYAYLGGSGTLPTVDLLELGGTDLLYLETRYILPVERIVLPLVGSPVLSVLHHLGSAGVGGLPALEQEIGVGIGLSVVHVDYTVDVARHRGSKLGVGISLGH
jgi:hypothetical protein